jgi:hypothetical protein
MSARRFIAALLLRSFPTRWRREYGEELADIISARPLSARVVADVATSGLRQRARAASPSTILGVLSMLLVSSQFVVEPSGWWPAAVRPSGMTFPTLRITLVSSELYVYVGIACGYWTEVRAPGAASRAGLAAMRMALIACSPVLVIGLLILAGLLDPDISGLAGRTFVPSSEAMILSALAALPPFWIWGTGGAWLRHWGNRRRESRQQRLT